MSLESFHWYLRPARHPLCKIRVQLERSGLYDISHPFPEDILIDFSEEEGILLLSQSLVYCDAFRLSGIHRRQPAFREPINKD